MVEVTGLEPAASASRTQRSTKLSHTSKYMPHHQYNIKIIYYYILNVKRNFRLPCFVFARQSCGLFYSSRILFSLSVATKASMSFRAVAESISYSESVLFTISSTVVSFWSSVQKNAALSLSVIIPLKLSLAVPTGTTISHPAIFLRANPFLIFINP